jgi:hypothetical protein
MFRMPRELVTSEKLHETLSPLPPPRSATVNILRPPSRTTWRCWLRRQGEGTHSERTTTPRHAAAARAHVAAAAPPTSSRALRKHYEAGIKNDPYYRNKNAILSSQVCSFTITRCTTVDFACDVHVVRSSISRLSKCLSVLIRALSRQSADSPARPRIAFAHDDDDDAHNSSRRKSAVLPDHCSILHPQVPSTILAPRRPLCRPNVTTLACPRRTGRRGGYIFSHRHDWMSA